MQTSLQDQRLPQTIRAALRPEHLIPALLAGLIIGILEIALSTSFAALIFSGDMTVYLPRGVGMALFSATVGVTITSLFTSYPAIMGGNQDAPAAILAVATAGIATAVTVEEARLPTVIVTIVLAAFLTGLFLFLLGTFRLAGLVRFLPYPVAGGFLAGTGWLLFSGAISTMSGLHLSIANLPALLEPTRLLYWLPGVALGAFILAFSSRIRHYLFMPGMVVAIIIGFYAISWLAGMTPTELSEGGYLLGPFPGGQLWQPVNLDELAAVEWSALWPQLPNLLSAVVISAIALLLNATGIELAMNRDIDLNREMRAAGVANIGGAMGAGLVTYAQLSLSMLVGRMGAANRLTGLVAGLICGTALLLGGTALGFLPTVVFGALLVYLGLHFLWDWAVVTWKRLPPIDYLIVWLILGVIAAFGFLPGVLIGIVATVTMFVISYSRTSVVKHELSGALFKSRVTRNPDDRALLDAIGDQAYFLQLQGFIFFGTAYTLLELVRARVREVPTRYIVIDFRQVIGLDSTALLSFDKMRQFAHENDVTLVLSSLSPKMRQQFERGGLSEDLSTLRYSSDIDRAAEWCEDQICATNEAGRTSKTLTEYLMAIVPGPATGRLVGYLDRQEVAAGEYIIKQGAAPDFLFFIEDGQVTAQLEAPNASPKRLETMQGGRAVGELGFYLGTRRSAAVVAERPSVIYRLSRETLDGVEKDDPEAAYAFHRVIIHLLGERVLHLVESVDALQA